MTTWSTRLGLVVLWLAAAGGLAAASQEPEGDGVVSIAVEVELDCPSCAAGLERRLGRLDGVGTVDVRPERGQVVVAPGPEGYVSPADVREVIRNAGFIPTSILVTAVGLVVDVGGEPALELPGGVTMTLTSDDVELTLPGGAGRRVRVQGHAIGVPADGPERLEVVSIEASGP